MSSPITILPPAIPARPFQKWRVFSLLVIPYAAFLWLNLCKSSILVVGTAAAAPLRLAASLYPPLAAAWFLRSFFSVPADLAHLPRAPLLPLLISYLRAEPETVRLPTIVLPYAKRAGAGVVVVWSLGRWMVHILDPNIGRAFADDTASFVKQTPPDDYILWKFIGKQNILVVSGDTWKRQAPIVKAAIDGRMPIDKFVALARRLHRRLGEGGRVRIEYWTQRYTLDVFGSACFNHDFHAIEDHDSPFVKLYHSIMDAIASPPYLLLPALERWWPRKQVQAEIDTFTELLRQIAEQKRTEPGDDMISYMLSADNLSPTEIRDNLIVFFSAGHDTTSGALTSWCFFMAKHPEYQQRARAEVLAVLARPGPDGRARDPARDLTFDDLQAMPFLLATVRETLRLNNPSVFGVPRVCHTPVRLGEYYVPAETSLLLNQYAILHAPELWPDPERFDPLRFGLEGQRPPEAWIPFMSGPRSCPGRNFALYEQRTFNAMLLREYEWSLPEDTIHKDKLQNAFSPFSMSLPHDVDLIFKKISHEEAAI